MEGNSSMMNETKKGIFGGVFISLGAFAYLTVLQKTNNIFLASLCFYLGLSLIMITKQNLFTGQVLTKANLPIREYIDTLIKTWIFNFIGSIITTILLSQILHPDITQLINNKLSLTPIQIVISAIFCNALVCCAVANYNKTKNHLMSWFYIFIFVIMSFEHCVADMSYIILGLQLQCTNLVASNIITLLICSTIGNIIGGRIMVSIINNKEVNVNE
jgi:formate/nitrite transporter FocA (FNT family)